MFCPECGFWVRKSYSYCLRCGKQLGNLERSSIGDIDTSTPQSVGSNTSIANHSLIGLPRDSGNNTTHTAAAAARNPLTRPLTFDQFNEKKSEERQGLSLRGSKKKSKSKTNTYGYPSGGVDVTINIGIMVTKHDGKTNPVRGKGLPLKIKKDAKAVDILQTALRKRIDCDFSFRSDYLCRLLCPDGKKWFICPAQVNHSHC